MTNQFKEVFISYGRRESLNFVARLHQQLKLAGHDIWFDKVNIPDGDDYQQRINHGIESAHNFVCIMAPRCLTSPFCLVELEYARLLGKRVIPINKIVIFKTVSQVLSDGDQQVMVNFYRFFNLPDQHVCTMQDVLDRSHALIGKTDWLDAKEKLSDADCQDIVNWAQPYENNWAKHEDIDYLNNIDLPVFGESIDALEGVVERLTAVLSRQTDYVHMHTDILVHALHWQNNQKATQHLLVGKERAAAEEWLLTEFLGGKQPPCQPTALVCEYICEARKNAENLMTDIFICYDAQDNNIRNLVIQSLSRYAKTCWTHDRDIQKGADYERAILEGIENADNFFYFISPHSVVSKYCRRELDHALQYNKRVVPLLIAPTEKSAFPDVLRELQYVDFTDNTCQADYDSDIDDILNILRRDHDYYEQHKILLARALKWQNENHKPAFLLRGHNLENAKTWLRLSDKREQHPPLDLHQQLITASEAAKGQLGTDIFLSYSRTDGDFARELNTALQEAGKTTWFDQESISTGVDFEKEIFKGIDSADNFVFVISKDAVESEYCEREVNYAADNSKRFITVLHRAIDPTTMPDALRKINWIDFKDIAFDKSFPELVQAIELDREHAHQHTVLQQRASDWAENNRSADFFLNATACTKAENWLKEAVKNDKQPPPTPLQQAHISESRQAIVAADAVVTKRNKTIFMATLSGMFIAFLLAIFAFIQMDKASEHLQNAKTRLYHAKVQEFSETNPTVALRLAEEAKKLDPLDETLDKMLEDIYANGKFFYRPPLFHDGNVKSAAFSHDGSKIVTTSNNKATVWDMLGKEPTSLGHNEVTSATFSPKDNFIVTTSTDNTATVWNMLGEELATLSRSDDDKTKSAVFSPDEQFIVTTSTDKIVTVWKVSEKVLVKPVTTGPDDEVKSVPDGQSIVPPSTTKTAKVWKLSEEKEVQVEEVATLSGHEDEVKSVVFSPDGHFIVTTSMDKTAKVWKLSGEKEVRVEEVAALS